jgi:hypothetical protein
MSEREIETRSLALPFQVDVWERGHLTHPWLNWPCVIYEEAPGEYWLGPTDATLAAPRPRYAHYRADAHIWTPKEWFERGYRATSRTWFYFIGQAPAVELPAAEMAFPHLTAARRFAGQNPGRRFLVQGRQSNKWYLRSFLDAGSVNYAVDERKEAGVFSGEELLNARFGEVDVRVELLPSSFIPPPAPQKIPIAQILSRNMIDSLERMPENEVIRTQVWSILKSPIPAEKKTYAQIKAWIEDNYNPKPSGSFRQSPPDGTPAMPVGGGPAVSGFSMSCDYGEQVSGTCHFSASQSGSDDYEVTGEMIREAAEEARAADDPRQEFERRLVSLLTRSVVENKPNTEMNDDEETCDHEIRDYAGSDADFSRTTLMERSLAWMQRYAPELAAAIFGEPEEDDDDDIEVDEPTT